MIVFKKPLLCRNQKLMKKIYYTIIAALYFSQNLWANQDSTLLNSSSSTADTSKSQNIAIDTIDIGADAFYTPFIFSEELNEDAEGIKEMVEEDHKAARRLALLKDHDLELPVSIEN